LRGVFELPLLRNAQTNHKKIEKKRYLPTSCLISWLSAGYTSLLKQISSATRPCQVEAFANRRPKPQTVKKGKNKSTKIKNVNKTKHQMH
jgi:hypothetical protein